ncbi:MAG: copper-containing nitrite reductase [Alphaproteobacteria bacterium]
MQFRKLRDWPLIGLGVALLVIVLVAWPRSSTTEAPAVTAPSQASNDIQMAPITAKADYASSAISATTGTQVEAGPGPISIVRDPSDLPPPVGQRGPRRVKVDLETIEVTGKLNDGATYRFWTFNGKVPGPFVRVRVGDIVEVHLKNREDSAFMHNVDFHAVLGPGGGAKATEAGAGEMRGFEFKALHPGLYVYHCAVMPAAQHIANGMYGLILVEPEGGLPKVDREFYVMQGELYTKEKFGAQGEHAEDYEKLIDERPEYFTFNGAVGALATEKPLKSKVDETVRVFFGVGGPNYDSSFHIIGTVFSRVYQYASLTSAPVTDVQTVTVAPGGAVVVDLKMPVPGNFVLVDHSLSRVQKGLAGILQVEGPPNPEIFRDYNPQRSAQVMSH